MCILKKWLNVGQVRLTECVMQTLCWGRIDDKVSPRGPALVANGLDLVQPK